MKKPNIRTKRKVARALLRYSRTMEERVKPIDKVRRFRPSAANTFLVGVMFDRSVEAERAWEAAEWFNDCLGDPEDVTALWKELVTMERKRLLGFLRYGYGGSAFHRHYRTFARQLPKAASLIIKEFGGDPRRLWRAQRNIQQVRENLEKIPGIGPALSRMAVLNLARNYGLLGGRAALAELDIKPDIHVMRVFKRAGLISKNASTTEAIETARGLSRRYPAALDAPTWEIGREWCRPRKPSCNTCPISQECPKLLLQR